MNEQESSLRGRQIFIAEDSFDIAFAMKALVEGCGATVCGPVGSLAQALELAREAPVDVALVDINLRGELAFPLLDALEARGIRTVILSGNAESVGSGSGAAEVLSKPVSGPCLIAALARALTPVAFAGAESPADQVRPSALC
jgi:CheY-like chemotaxis protein